MNDKIAAFITTNQVLTIATSVKDIPYCATCFYVFDEINKTLIFLSDSKTRHIQEAQANMIVAGTINNGITAVDQIQGIQFTGEFIIPSDEEKLSFYELYYKRFPFAKEMPSPIWGIKLNWLKMTDNTLGFGTKLIWESRLKD